MSASKVQQLKLNGKTAVFIDYANVYGWRDELKKPVDPKKLFKYLKQYPEIEKIYFYYGQDNNPQSKKFLKEIKEIGFSLITKPVKHIVVGQVDSHYITKRKCDFDIEICMTVYECLEEKFTSFVFFTGDGDFEPVYKFLIKRSKKILVIYEQGHLGKEIWQITQGLFKTRFSFLNYDQNNPRHIGRGAIR